MTKAVRNDGGDNQPLIEETLSLPAEDILMIHVADGQTVEHHCPDFALLRMQEHRQIVLVIVPRSYPASSWKCWPQF